MEGLRFFAVFLFIIVIVTFDFVFWINTFGVNMHSGSFRRFV